MQEAYALVVPEAILAIFNTFLIDVYDDELACIFPKLGAIFSMPCCQIHDTAKIQMADHWPDHALPLYVHVLFSKVIIWCSLKMVTAISCLSKQLFYYLP